MKIWVKLPTDFHPEHRTNGMVSVDPVEGWEEYVPAADYDELDSANIRLGEKVKTLREALALALSFCPTSVVPGLGPEFYHTLSYEGDAKLQQKLDEARAALAAAKGDKS